MKEKIHPDYHKITVVMTDGTSFETKSTWGKEGASLRLDIDPKTHPAWTGVRQSVDRGGRVQRFKNRFGMTGSADVGMGAGTKATGVKAGATPANGAAKKKQDEVRSGRLCARLPRHVLARRPGRGRQSRARAGRPRPSLHGGFRLRQGQSRRRSGELA